MSAWATLIQVRIMNGDERYEETGFLVDMLILDDNMMKGLGIVDI